MKAIVYRRVSTDEQGADGLGMEAQAAVCAAHVAHAGYEEVTYTEDVCSGGTSPADRRGLAVALARLAAGEADVLVVSKLDRLSRSVIDFGTLLERSVQEGWALVILDCQVDTRTASGRMVANVLATFAEFERSLISERTKAALAERRRRGMAVGRPRQWSDELALRIAKERAEGRSYQTIADGLNADQVPTTGKGSHWWPNSVRSIFTQHMGTVANA